MIQFTCVFDEIIKKPDLDYFKMFIVYTIEWEVKRWGEYTASGLQSFIWTKNVLKSGYFLACIL